MNYAEIKPIDIANGIGIRVSLFVSGCTHHCKGCFNRETWDFSYGKPFDEGVQREILEYLSYEYINGLSLLGGEPFEPENQSALLPFLETVRKTFPEKDIWCYTGYSYEKDLASGGKAYCKYTEKMLSLIDILVDGEFILDLKNISLKFRGSENQRIIDLNQTRKCGKIVLSELNY